MINFLPTNEQRYRWVARRGSDLTRTTTQPRPGMYADPVAGAVAKLATRPVASTSSRGKSSKAPKINGEDAFVDWMEIRYLFPGKTPIQPRKRDPMRQNLLDQLPLMPAPITRARAGELSELAGFLERLPEAVDAHGGTSTHSGRTSTRVSSRAIYWLLRGTCSLPSCPALAPVHWNPLSK